MQKLTRERFDASRKYLVDNARPIDRALFSHFFDCAAVQPVIDALKAYANPDGGFGRGLEPDLRAEESSALATSVALQKVRLSGSGFRHDSVAGAVRYLIETIEPHPGSGGLGWRIIPSSARLSTVQSAPWWSAPPSADNTCAMFNPSAELLGYLIEYRDSGGNEPGLVEVIAGVSRFVLRELSQDQGPLEAHDLLCLNRLAATPGLPDHLYTAARARLLHDAPQATLLDPSSWGEYGLMPLGLVPAPDDDLITALGRSVVDANLDYEINRQQPQGCWNPFWDWGPDRRAGWEQARSEWQSELTLNTLLTLRWHNRIA